MLNESFYQKKFRFGFYILFATVLFSVHSYAQSTISGSVYDKHRNPVIEVDLELLNENYQVRGRTKTDSAGRYTFGGLSDGRYTVKALPFRFDLEDQEFMVEVITLNIRGGQGVGFYSQDFYLNPKRGGLAEAELGVIFAQDVPREAKLRYDKAVDDLSKKRTESGILGLNEAIKTFPDYYEALHRIGKELVFIKGYRDAIPYLLKATEINPKSATSFYYLGTALHQLGKEYNKAAIASLSHAAVLAPASPQVLFALGKAERASGSFKDAEKHLLQAKKVSKASVPEIHGELAQLYGNDLKKYKEAADELELYLKATKMDGDQSKAIKKKIAELREKAKTQITKG